MLLKAALLNVELLLSLLAVGFIVGTIVAVLQVYGGRVLGVLAFVFEWVFRSIPPLVLLFLVYFGPERFGLSISRFLSATIALGLCSSGYQSQIFRGAIQSISSGQMMAARALGMSRTRAIASVILPQAFRLSIPGWSNEFSGSHEGHDPRVRRRLQRAASFSPCHHGSTLRRGNAVLPHRGHHLPRAHLHREPGPGLA